MKASIVVLDGHALSSFPSSRAIVAPAQGHCSNIYPSQWSTRCCPHGFACSGLHNLEFQRCITIRYHFLPETPSRGLNCQIYPALHESAVLPTFLQLFGCYTSTSDLLHNCFTDLMDALFSISSKSWPAAKQVHISSLITTKCSYALWLKLRTSYLLNFFILNLTSCGPQWTQDFWFIIIYLLISKSISSPKNLLWLSTHFFWPMCWFIFTLSIIYFKPFISGLFFLLFSMSLVTLSHHFQTYIAWRFSL